MLVCIQTHITLFTESSDADLSDITMTKTLRRFQLAYLLRAFGFYLRVLKPPFFYVKHSKFATTVFLHRLTVRKLLFKIGSRFSRAARSRQCLLSTEKNASLRRDKGACIFSLFFAHQSTGLRSAGLKRLLAHDSNGPYQKKRKKKKDVLLTRSRKSTNSVNKDVLESLRTTFGNLIHFMGLVSVKTTWSNFIQDTRL